MDGSPVTGDAWTYLRPLSANLEAGTGWGDNRVLRDVVRGICYLQGSGKALAWPHSDGLTPKYVHCHDCLHLTEICESCAPWRQKFLAYCPRLRRQLSVWGMATPETSLADATSVLTPVWQHGNRRDGGLNTPLDKIGSKIDEGARLSRGDVP